MTKNTSVIVLISCFLIVCAYGGSDFIVSGIDDHIYGSATSITLKIAESGSISNIDNMLVSWPAPFILNTIHYDVSGFSALESAWVLKQLYLCVIMIIITSIWCHSCRKKLDILNKTYLLIPITFNYIYKFYQQTTALFLPLFIVFLYISIFNPSKFKFMLATALVIVMSFSHGFSNSSLLGVLFCFLIYYIYEKRKTNKSNIKTRNIYRFSMVGIAIISLILIFNYIQTFSYPLSKALSFIFSPYREDVMIFLGSESMYSNLYRKTLQILLIPLLFIAVIGLFSKICDALFVKRYVIPVMFAFSPIVYFEYFTETIPRLMSLCLPFLVLLYIFGINKISIMVKQKIIIFLLIMFIVGCGFTMVSIANLGQPFRYVSEASSTSLLQFKSIYKNDILETRSFTIKDYINYVFYHNESENIFTYKNNGWCNVSLIYMGSRSERWKAFSFILV